MGETLEYNEEFGEEGDDGGIEYESIHRIDRPDKCPKCDSDSVNIHAEDSMYVPGNYDPDTWKCIKCGWNTPMY